MIRRALLNHTASVHATLRRKAPLVPLAQRPSSHSSLPSSPPLRAALRYYSASAEQATKESAEGSAQAATGPERPAAEDAAATEHAQAQEQKKDASLNVEELEKKNREIVDLKDRYLRSVADFRNLQERTKREVQAARDFALQRFAKDLVDSVDNLDRALSTVAEDKIDAENKDLVNLHSGLKMTETILMQTLKKHGLERFDPSETKDKFDPNLHEATFQAPQPDKEDGTVFHTQQKGFMLNGRVLRV
ncbi:MAG: Mitochondrial matrix cochaperone [Bathelium mastoideum]|nr:MAG: Mitochondrial matrix cochaperone [Bathelium mastoideum]